MELRKSGRQAKIDIAEYMKTAPIWWMKTVTLLTDPADLAAGKEISQPPGLCHRADVWGQIGPNLRMTNGFRGIKYLYLVKWRTMEKEWFLERHIETQRNAESYIQ
jgi:hypothetical protein